MTIDQSLLTSERHQSITNALNEDIGTGDVTAELIGKHDKSSASMITRENCVVCGIDWVNETFKRLDDSIELTWLVNEGQHVSANTELLKLRGNTRMLLTGERTALNFLQLLSGVASKAANYATLVDGTDIKILDTRKTLPGLRFAQKYAVEVGGCFNHRIALYLSLIHI